MPNHVKNRIEIIGSEKQVKKVLEKFSTSYEKKVNRTSNKKLIICDDSNNEFVGWFNDNTNEFEYSSNRGEKIKGLPEGFKYEYNNAFIQMPDFNKIIKCPESLNVISGSFGDMGYSIITGESQNQFMDMQEYLRRFYELDENKRIEVLEQGIIYFKNIKEHGCKTWYDWHIKFWGTKWNSYSCEKESENVFTFETAWSGISNLIELISKEFPEIKFIYEYSDEDTGCNCGIGTYLNGELSLDVLENSSKEAYDLAFKLRPDCKEYYKLVDNEYICDED